MKIKLAENIKAFRKERKMTQEQLAEALGVTVGAVHKWEKELSTPDLSIIFAMADLFGTSTDVLLGYQWQNSSVRDSVQKVQQLIQEKNFEDAVAEAENAMRKFPNIFEIVYHGAMAYLEWSRTFDMNGGMKDWQKAAHTRGEEVFKHALELLPQNQDPEINHISLSRQFSEFHEFCMYIYRAIDVLKESNICGINDAKIGQMYVGYLHDLAQAEAYLSKAYTTALRDMDCVITGFADICSERDDCKNAIACLEWSRKLMQGIQPEEDITELTRSDIRLDLAAAFYSCDSGDLENTHYYLKRMLEKAVRFDAAAPEDIKVPVINTIMHIQELPHYVNMWTGQPITEWLKQLDWYTDEDLPGFKAIWKAVKEEVL